MKLTTAILLCTLILGAVGCATVPDKPGGSVAGAGVQIEDGNMTVGEKAEWAGYMALSLLLGVAGMLW